VKIDNSIGNKTIATPSGEKKVVRNPGASATSTVPAKAGDEVSLTSSSQLQAMGSSIGEAQPVDTAKVEAIKQAISEGHFKINPERIAERLLTSVQELLTSQKS